MSLIEDQHELYQLKQKKLQWETIQNNLKSQLIETDELPDTIKYIGGVDISFVKKDPSIACVALVVIGTQSIEPLYLRTKMIKITEPYIAGFLAFREVNPIIDLLTELRRDNPKLMPDVIFVDGNGKHHHRGFGLACHLGVLTGIPCIGIGKNLLWVDGLKRDSVVANFRKKCTTKGCNMDLIGNTGTVWGAAVKTSEKAINPLYVSIGHKVTLKTAVELTLKYSKFRIPEPIRIADHKSREYIQSNYFEKRRGCYE